MATYAISDLQGCFDPLMRLLDTIGFTPESDRLWFVGDLVNRGPQSLEVLRFVKGLGDTAVTVLGNHDLYLVVRAAGHVKPSHDDTIASILNATDRDELTYWLRTRPLVHTETISGNPWLMVHAGLLPSWHVAKAKALADEVGSALIAPNYLEFLANMWGSEPDAWCDDLVGWDRLRVIVNAMTRMRFIRPDGRMVFKVPGAEAPPEHGPAGCVPWFDAPGRKNTDHTILFGHWAALGLRTSEKLLALDSGCLWGGSLTAVRLDDRRVFKAPCKQYVAIDYPC